MNKLVSKNPIQRFKQKNFKLVDPVTTLKTGGNILIYKKGSKAYYATSDKYLKIANKLGLYSRDDVKAYQKKLGVKDDGIWGNDTQKAYNNKFSSKMVSPVQTQKAGIITSSNPSKTYKPWRPTEKVGVVGACGTENCSEWANKSLKRHKDFKGRLLYANDEVGGDAWTRLSAGKHAKMVYSGYDGMDYDPNNYNYDLAHQRNWQAAQNLYDNFDSKTLDKNKTYLVNMYYNGSPQTENAWRNGTNGTTGTHTGNLYWNPETNSWRVAHNIHNKLYDDDFIKIQGVRKGKYQYGVTAIAEAPMTDYTRQDWNEAHPIKSAINRIYDFGMWKEGGKLIKAQYGTELPEVTVTAIDVNKHAGSPEHRKFIRSLNSNRNEFIKKYKLSDQQYADLSKFALNLTGAESSNGYDKNVFRRTYIYPDWMIHLGKLLKRGKDSANSRGLTQIKYDDDIKNPDLQKYYIDLGITGRNIKYDPSYMARATLGRTLWIQDQLKKQYGDQPVHYADGTEMPQEIAQYLYWNRGKVTDKANGNPETGSTIGAANSIKYYNSRKNI